MCRNGEHTSCWSHFSIIFDQRLLCTLHSNEYVFLPLCLCLGQSSHHAIHVIKHVIVDSDDDVMQSTGMPFQHLQDAVPEWSQNVHGILDNSQLILSCEEGPVFAILKVFKQLGCESTQSVGALEPLH